jgi:hypothetical protein
MGMQRDSELKVATSAGLFWYRQGYFLTTLVEIFLQILDGPCQEFLPLPGAFLLREL